MRTWSSLLIAAPVALVCWQRPPRTRTGGIMVAAGAAAGAISGIMAMTMATPRRAL